MAKFFLTDIELEETLSEIITGKRIFCYNDETMCVRTPTSRDKDSSRTIYIRKYKEFEKMGLPKKEELKVELIKSGSLERDFYIKKDRIQKEIDKLYSARNKTGSAIQLAQIDADISMAFENFAKMEVKEDQLMVNSLEYNAESYRINYLISRIVLCGIELEDRKWSTYEDFLNEKDRTLISECKRKYNEVSLGIPVKIIRAVARSEEWKRRWDIAKKTGSPVFDGVSSDWDKNKVNLCYWSTFYDNIIDNLKLKNEDIINDDEALFETIRKINNGQENNSSNGTGEVVKVSAPYRVRY